MALNGTSVLIMANTGTPTSPVYTVVASQKDLKMNEAVAKIDVSSKDSPNERVIGGRYSSTVDFDALYVPTDAAYQALETSFRARNLILVQVWLNGVAEEQANCLITKLDRNFPDQKESTVALACVVDNGWTALVSGGF